MKHKLREEKNCLNCGAQVEEIYCPHCGQENIDPHESFGSLLYHFFSDFTHFDSKFFTTLKDLLFRPGFLTRQYMEGKRNSYLHPIRMYIFISFVFFLALGLISHDFDIYPGDKQGTLTANDSLAAVEMKQVIDSLKTNSDVSPSTLKTINNIAEKLNVPLGDTVVENQGAGDSLSGQKTTIADDGVVHTLSEKKKKWKEKYGANYAQIMIEKGIHDIPKALFLLLPLFALFLKGLYRKRSYVGHAIFALHYHSFIFLLLLLSLLINNIFKISVTGYAILIIFVYLIAGLHNLYKQSILRSVFKGFILTTIYAIAISFALVGVSFIVFVMI